MLFRSYNKGAILMLNLYWLKNTLANLSQVSTSLGSNEAYQVRAGPMRLSWKVCTISLSSFVCYPIFRRYNLTCIFGQPAPSYFSNSGALNFFGNAPSSNWGRFIAAWSNPSKFLKAFIFSNNFLSTSLAWASNSFLSSVGLGSSWISSTSMAWPSIPFCVLEYPSCWGRGALSWSVL